MSSTQTDDPVSEVAVGSLFDDPPAASVVAKSAAAKPVTGKRVAVKGSPRARPVPVEPSQSGAPKFYRVVMDDVDGYSPGGQFFGINGRAWMLQGGRTYVIPEALKTVLDQALESVAVLNPDTRRIEGYRNRLRFPYRVERVSTDPKELEGN